MLRVGQVDAYAGLVDYKVHVIIIELSSDVWKKNTAYYAAASKGSDCPVLQPGAFHHEEEPGLGITARRCPGGRRGDGGTAALHPTQVWEGWRVTPRQHRRTLH